MMLNGWETPSGGRSELLPCGLPWCRSAAQQTFRAQVFVNVGPMDAVAGAGDLPARQLLGRGIGKTRIPRERHGYGAPVHEIDTDRISIDSHVLDTLIAKIPMPSLQQIVSPFDHRTLQTSDLMRIEAEIPRKVHRL